MHWKNGSTVSIGSTFGEYQDVSSDLWGSHMVQSVNSGCRDGRRATGWAMSTATGLHRLGTGSPSPSWWAEPRSDGKEGGLPSQPGRSSGVLRLGMGVGWVLGWATMVNM